ncbi:MAG TPA: hypothetical protein VN929_14000 [Burkholderiales bacterium]|nr:hypothetical protein [Burkholderiales bacterium]
MYIAKTLMPTAIPVVLCFAFLLVTGCANPEQHIYEGLKARESMVHPSLEPTPGEKSMSYSEYEAERKRLLEGEGKK